jgi:hypothetical protein
MAAINELINYLVNFTPEQLEQFLNHEITLSILQPEEASESYLPGVPSNA